MRRPTTTITGLLLTLVSPASSPAFAQPPATVDSQRDDSSTRGFDRFLRRYEDANTAFVNGDPTLWLSLAADVDPVSIFGGFGGLGEAGIEVVHQRYLLAATAFRPSGAVVSFEYLAKDVRGRLAYTVSIERAQVLYAGHTERQQQILRSTMLFRFDRGGWKIIHRHADTMIDLQLPTTPVHR
jgi:SnoaL-like domain